MIERKDLFSIPFYNKTQYTGSHLGMRYRIEKHVEDDSTTLLATWWPGPYCIFLCYNHFRTNVLICPVLFMITEENSSTQLLLEIL